MRDPIVFRPRFRVATFDEVRAYGREGCLKRRLSPPMAGAASGPWQLIGAEGAVAGTGALNAAVNPAYGAGATRSPGNLLVCWVAEFGTNAAPPTPTGWSFIVGAGAAGLFLTAFGKQAVGADAAPTFASSATQGYLAKVNEFGYGSTVPFGRFVPGGIAQGAADAWGLAFPTVTLNTGASAVRYLDGLLLFLGMATFAAGVDTTVITITPGPPFAALNEVNNQSASATKWYSFGWGLSTSEAGGNPTALAWNNVPGATSTTGLAAFLAPLVTPTAQPRGMTTGA